MKQVWAVSSGSYSDYRVEAVCATKAVAEALAELWNRVERRYGVEALPFYTRATQGKPGMTYHHRVSKGGDESAWSYVTLPHRFQGDEANHGASDFWAWGRSNVSAARAKKIAHDKAAELKARQEDV